MSHKSYDQFHYGEIIAESSNPESTAISLFEKAVEFVQSKGIDPSSENGTQFLASLLILAYVQLKDVKHPATVLVSQSIDRLKSSKTE